MATNKNQHYVPRCYLKEFTHNSEGKAINVYNIDNNRCIPLAPVKNQCSRNYFYGNDEKLENAIQFVEGSYASVLKELIHGSVVLNDRHKIIIKRFWLLQYLRTEASSRRSVEMLNGMNEVVGISGAEFNLGIKEAVILSMKTYVDCLEIIDDLKICLVRNKTEFPFVTSDDPAILSNRWHLNDQRTMFRSFGLRTAGALLFLPLTPRLMCVAYDGDVYSVDHKNGWACVSQLNDLKSFNQMQILNCRANIFIKEMEHAPFINQSIEEVSERRLAERHRINYAVLDYVEGGYSCYKVVDHRAEGESEKAIMHSEALHFRPTLWPGIIKWRDKGAVFTNGTGVGYVRKRHIPLDSRNFYKESTRQKKKHA